MLSLRRVLRYFSTNSSKSHTYEMHTQINETNRSDEFIKYYKKDQMIPGQCTPQATLQFSQRNSEVDPSNWKQPFNSELKLSSIGVGTYSTYVEQKDDIKLFNALIDSALLGVNVFDTCSQFRYSKGERVINAALKYLIKEKHYNRNEFFIGTKLGYLSDDMDLQIKGDQIVKDLINQKLLSEDDVIENTHCVHPNYLQYMFERSRLGLGLEMIDVVYLNNFPETQMEQIGKDKFIERLQKAFQFFERKVNDKKLQYYGLSSYSSFRVKDKPYSLELQEVEKVAERVGGREHKFRFLQVPMNIVASQAFGMGTQTWVDGEKKEEATIVGVANRLKINVVSCSPLMRGTLINIPVPGSAMKCSNNGAKHLQFIRSIPTPALLTTLVGQNLNRHVKTNLQVLTVPRLTQEEWMDFVKPSMRKDVDSQ